ncbi:MAG TPA: hypothetical protein VLE96_06435 [Chlamydiales bacterium]|nr:hypothetical protein [Chlamydiales bacterium]
MKFFTTLCTLALLTGCASNTGTGLISGTTLAATIGGIKWGGEGALIGSAIGLVTGSILGVILDEQDRKIMQQSSPRTIDRMDRGEPLTINDIIKLSQSGVSDDTIIRYIQEKQTIYNLTQAQARRLRDAGVSQQVIQFMLNKNRE